MLSADLETRISKIIEKLDELAITKKRPVKDNFLFDCEKYEYLIQKNAQKRMSQVTEKITDFLNPDNSEEENKKKENNDSSEENTPSIALNLKKMITIGEFQIELDKLLEILEESLNNNEPKKEDNNKYLSKYVNDISISTDDNSVLMDNDTKIKKFGETLKKKYNKISLLLKRYIRENGIVDDLIKKERIKNGGMKKVVKGRKRRSLFDNIPSICEREYKVVKELPNFGNTLLSEVEENIKKKKRISYVNIGEENKEDEKDKSENSEDSEEEIEENGEKIPVYRPGKLRSSFMFM